MSELILDKDFFVKSLKDMGELAEKNRDNWTKLDSDIGDGDHGINLSIGFREVIAHIEELEKDNVDISALFKKVGMMLLSKVGGASGPLYGSFFMKLGKDVVGKNEVTFDEFVNMLENGVEAIQLRGKAELKDKTMLDAFLPGINYLKENLELNDPELLMQNFITEMKKGSDSTIPLIAKKGRAMRLGERAIGHRDPGSESAWMLMEVFYKNMLQIM
ncbi:dihydroxyacetone kinase subunit DhaL [Vaginisenegalia massiliensis]|uniref:dihydroxyacetone kinase subunit DhaL n=1 Tax=Vaginisenegalia massiliensis TaxID=2058294 RepID=UPI000F538B5B|nr:dihydroxyacetone kinase subunit DhaL [Vaginisenegalia massiliensis]